MAAQGSHHPPARDPLGEPTPRGGAHIAGDSEYFQERAYSVRELAERAGGHYHTILRLEGGKGAHPRTVLRLAQALGVEPKELRVG